VRVRWNEPRGQALLLYPEGALALNPTAHAVLELCDGRRTVAQIVAELAGRFDATSGDAPGRPERPSDEPAEQGAPARRQRMETEVITFLERLRRRGWVADVSAL
jgi:coenzyme PQQ biosynthesis protein PqqD